MQSYNKKTQIYIYGSISHNNFTKHIRQSIIVKNIY